VCNHAGKEEGNHRENKSLRREHKVLSPVSLCVSFFVYSVVNLPRIIVVGYIPYPHEINALVLNNSV
jgi:hypothetical protein